MHKPDYCTCHDCGGVMEGITLYAMRTHCHDCVNRRGLVYVVPWERANTACVSYGESHDRAFGNEGEEGVII